ncbi:hypothetical protein CALK_0564 [Chitinivibrio alkaliphilus ACht1]|uniref:Uncharacterized protein n=1 Tax=Chitinivibrio alkaliphilus ACht1 TaxID=1313304 RepID=U7D8T7_9BACT|nr:hypothetical protein CALK_0564 [Chitinivibrio alkaliphilus ACht1]
MLSRGVSHSAAMVQVAWDMISPRVGVIRFAHVGEKMVRVKRSMVSFFSQKVHSDKYTP